MVEGLEVVPLAQSHVDCSVNFGAARHGNGQGYKSIVMPAPEFLTSRNDL